MPTHTEHHTESARPADDALTLAASNFYDPAAWSALSGAQSSEEFCRAWLQLQCALIEPSPIFAQLLLVRQGVLHVQGAWSRSAKPQEPNAALSAVANAVIREKKPLVNALNTRDPRGSAFYVGYPVLMSGEVYAVVLIDMGTQNDEHLRRVMRQLQWGAAWFDKFYANDRSKASDEINQRLLAVLDVTAAALEHSEFKAALSSVTTEMANYLGCERASIGFRRGNRVRVAGISHSATFSKKTNLVRLIGDAMDESRDQASTIVYPPVANSQGLIFKAQQNLARESGSAAVCTVPLMFGENIVGAMSFEHTSENYFNEAGVQACEQFALLLGPLVELRRKESRWLLGKVLDSASAQLSNIIGPKHLGVKLVAAMCLALVAVLVFVPGTHRVSADAIVEGKLQRHIASPIDGYIHRSLARAGDIVKQGQVLFSLETEDLVLEKNKWENQLSQVNHKYRDAMAQSDRVKIGVLLAQREQAQAQLNLITSQLARTQVKAPFDGIIVAGDLRERLGSPVTQGESLLKIAPLEGHRLALHVDEKDIRHIRLAQRGKLSLSSMPHDTFEFTVQKITPVAKAEEGVNRFTVEAELVEQSEQLRPGMQGIGKITIAQRRLLWIYTHRFTEWVRLWSWAKLP